MQLAKASSGDSEELAGADVRTAGELAELAELADDELLQAAISRTGAMTTQTVAVGASRSQGGTAGAGRSQGGTVGASRSRGRSGPSPRRERLFI
jgi:hypothetical protein